MNISKLGTNFKNLSASKAQSTESPAQNEGYSATEESQESKVGAYATQDGLVLSDGTEVSGTYDKDLAAKEGGKLWKKGKIGALVGSVLGAAGGVAAGLVGGAAGALVGLAAAPATGLLGMGLGAVAAFKMVMPKWTSKGGIARILLATVAGAAGAAAGGALGTYGGAALGAAAGAGGGVAGVVAGLIGGSTAGALAGGLGTVGVEQVRNPEKYKNFETQSEEAAQNRAAREARDEIEMAETKREFVSNLKDLFKNPRKFD